MRDISNDTNHWRNGLHFYWNNDMGILVDSLPKKLEDMGVTGVNRKACYKYYFKRGTPLCKAEFDKLSANLQLFIDNRNATKEDW